MKTEGQYAVPSSLRKWFIVHFIADITFAIPMFVFPVAFLSFLGWQQVDPITSRMVAAALFGIGIESLLSRNSSRESFQTMLSLKIIWSSAAIIGVAMGLLSGLFTIAAVGISILIIFILFNILWTYWFIQLKSM